MRILQIAPRSPYPPVDGGRIAMLAILDGLMDSGCDVDLLALNPRRQEVDEHAVRDAVAPARAMLVPHDTDSLARTLVASLTWRTSPPLARFASSTLETVVIEWLKRQNVHVVHLESVFLAWLIPAIRRFSNAPVVIRTQNIEFPILRQVAEAEPHWRKRAVLRTWAALLRKSEIAAWNSCDAVIPISPEDAAETRRLGCHVPLFVLPTGVDVSPEPAAGDMNVSWFLGSLDYMPNRHAALWLAREVFPRLRQLAPEATIAIGGNNPAPELLEQLAASGVTVERSVPDADAFANARGVALAPVFSGGGMRIKILQALARGNPLVATSIAASGMDVKDGEHLLIADDPQAYANAIVRLMRDGELRARLVANGRELVKARYDNASLARGLADFYRRLVSGSKTRPRSARK